MKRLKKLKMSVYSIIILNIFSIIIYLVDVIGGNYQLTGNNIFYYFTIRFEYGLASTILALIFFSKNLMKRKKEPKLSHHTSNRADVLSLYSMATEDYRKHTRSSSLNHDLFRESISESEEEIGMTQEEVGHLQNRGVKINRVSEKIKS